MPGSDQNARCQMQSLDTDVRIGYEMLNMKCGYHNNIYNTKYQNTNARISSDITFLKCICQEQTWDSENETVYVYGKYYLLMCYAIMNRIARMESGGSDNPNGTCE